MSRGLAWFAIGTLCVGFLPAGAGASAASTATVERVSTALAVDLRGPLSVPLGTVANFSVTASGGTPPYNFGWTVNGTAIASGDSPSIGYRPLVDGVDLVAVEVRDAAGREGNASLDLLVTGPGPVAVKIVYDGASAAGGAEFTAQTTGGSAPYRYLWRGTGAGPGWTTAANWTTPPLPAGTFTYRVTAMDQRGYRAESAPIVVKSQPRTVVSGGSSSLVVLAVALGAGLGAAGGAFGWVMVRQRSRHRANRR